MANYVCRECGDSFHSYNPTPKFCSRRCKSLAQTAVVDAHKIQALYSGGQTQAEIAKTLGVTQKVVFAAMRRAGISARKAAKRNQWGENNHAWKGDSASKCAFHRRLYSRFGKPAECGVCGTTDAGHYDYANLTGRYEDIEDYLPMCRSCHWRYDDKHMNFRGKGDARDVQVESA